MSFKNIFMRMEVQVITALILATLTWIYFPQITPYVAWMWDLFLNLLKVFLGPILFFSVILAISGLGDIRKLWKIGLRTFWYYFFTGLCAITLSVWIMNLVKPGGNLNLKEFWSYSPEKIQEFGFTDFILSLIPSNIFQAFVQVNALQIVVIALILWVFLVLSQDISKKKKEVFLNFIEVGNTIIMKFICFVIRLTPFWVFGIVTKVVSTNWVESMIGLLPFVFTVLAILFIHALITLPLLGAIIIRTNIFHYMYQIREALFIAFSTSSSAATLPITMKAATEAGIEKEIINFTFPIGTTINMDGTAMYQAAVVLFIAQLVGLDMSLIQQLSVVGTIVIASLWTAGIPGASILILPPILISFWLPVEAIGLILAFDRLLDMFRTTVNVWWDMVTAKFVDSYYKKILISWKI